jgi:recombination protein RecA
MAKKEMTELDKDLKAALDLITKQFGSEALMTCDDASIKKVDVISTGSLNLDVALGVGGLPEGRINTIYGEASSGKSTIALQLVANAQKKGLLCAYLDSEHAVDLGYAKALGVDLKHLLFAQPESGTACFAIAEALLKQGKVKLIVFDSVSTMLSDAEIHGEMGDNFIGRQAKMMSDGLKRITPLASKSKCMCFFISQTRKNIGVMYGDTDVMSGGESLKFYSSVIMKIWKKQSPNTERINGVDIATSVETTVKVVKNKVAPPFKTAKFIIRYGKGVSQEEEILDLAFDFGLLEKAGSWVRYNGENIAQGKEKAMAWLKEDPDRMAKFKETILSYIAQKHEEMDIVSEESDELEYDPETGEIL